MIKEESSKQFFFYADFTVYVDLIVIFQIVSIDIHGSEEKTIIKENAVLGVTLFVWCSAYVFVPNLSLDSHHETTKHYCVWYEIGQVNVILCRN